MDIGFGDAVLLFGGLLAVVAALSGVMRGTVLSASVLSVALGIGLAAAGVVNVDADRPVDRRADRAGADPHPLLRRDVRRARAAAPPLEPGRPRAGDRDADHDGAAGAGGEGALPELSWAEAFLLGAVLSPTDPVVTSAVVTSRLVPERGPPHAQPRVRPQRRPGAALRPLLPRPRLARRRRRRPKRRSWRRGAGRRRRSGSALGVPRRPPAPPPPRRRDHRRATRGSTRSASPSSPSASPT